MTYFGFLLRFLVIPILILAGVTLWNERRGQQRAPSLRGTSVGLAIGLHMLIALIYTTPWDNYLVATGVWWYDPALVTGIVLGWSLPPIMLQLAFGADILWRYRRIVFLSIVPVTLYLITADALAIHAGTWTIDPARSFGIFLGGVLPIEEFAFFLMTNVLLTSGMVLLWAEESHERLAAYRVWLQNKTQRRVLVD